MVQWAALVGDHLLQGIPVGLRLDEPGFPASMIRYELIDAGKICGDGGFPGGGAIKGWIDGDGTNRLHAGGLKVGQVEPFRFGITDIVDDLEALDSRAHVDFRDGLAEDHVIRLDPGNRAEDPILEAPGESRNDSVGEWGCSRFPFYKGLRLELQANQAILVDRLRWIGDT